MATTDQEIINKYRSKLRAANVLESKDPQYAQDKLHECVELLGQLENPTKRYQLEKTTLEKRIAKFHTKNISTEIVQEKPIEEVKEEPVEPVEEIQEKPIEEIQEEAIEEIQEEAIEEIQEEPTDEVKEEPTDEVKEETIESEVIKEGPDVGTSYLASEQFAIPYSAKVFDLLPDIIEELYTGLMEDKPLEYQDYFTFFQSFNDLYPEPLPPIIYQESNVSFYVGDTHGAFSETRTIIKYFDRILSHPDSKSKSIKIIFLGDYVDRNPNDLENLTLIIAFWLKFPENVIILRGNHEDIKINKYYGFYKNLTDTFVIEEWVENLYKEILYMFVKLPIAHVGALQNLSNGSAIRVFSVHAGIPIDMINPNIPVNLMDVFEEIQANVTTFEEFDHYMEWLLWADPKEGGEKGIILRPDTGRNQYGLAPFNEFMDLNNLQFMVRAHEVLENGYKYFFNDRLISLFTASTYKNRPIGKAAFLRLEADKSPVILSTDSDMLDMDFDYWSKTLLPTEN